CSLVSSMDLLSAADMGRKLLLRLWGILLFWQVFQQWKAPAWPDHTGPGRPRASGPAGTTLGSPGAVPCDLVRNTGPGKYSFFPFCDRLGIMPGTAPARCQHPARPAGATICQQTTVDPGPQDRLSPHEAKARCPPSTRVRAFSG